MTFEVTNNTNTSLFAIQPSIDSDGTLHYTPQTDAVGQAILTLVLHDDGGTSYGGKDTSAPQTFAITISSIIGAPSGADSTVTTVEDTPYTFGTLDFGFSDPDGDLLKAIKITTLPTAGTLTLYGILVNAGDYIDEADVTDGGLEFVPAPDANGSPYATFTFQVQDDSGIAGADLDPVARTMKVVVTPVNDAPTGLSLSPAEVMENQPSGTTVGTFTTTDPDTGDSFTYTLVSGSGDADNSSFTISGNTLKTAETFDYETRSSYSIRVRTTDQGELYYEKAFTVTITDQVAHIVVTAVCHLAPKTSHEVAPENQPD